MLNITQRLKTGTADTQLVLPLEQRVKARFKAKLENGVEVGLMLDRGPIMRGGDLLLAEDGTVVEIVAANEPVSVVKTKDAYLLMRVAYHLGNRHVVLQILEAELRYQPDHVLDEMVVGLGVKPEQDVLPFEPEAGAYARHGHQHDH